MTGIIENLNENIAVLNQNIERLIVALGSASVGKTVETSGGTGFTAATEKQTGADDTPSNSSGEVPWDESKGKDKRGMYHDTRVHSKNGSKNADGTFRVAKGLDNREQKLAEIKAEQDAYYAAQGDDIPDFGNADETQAGAGGGMFETQTREMEGGGDDRQVDFDGLFKEAKEYMIEAVKLFNNNAMAQQELTKIFESVGIQQINQANESNISSLHYNLSQLVQSLRPKDDQNDGDDPDAALRAMMG